MRYTEHEIPKKGGKVRKIVSPDDDLKEYLRSKLKGLFKYYRQYAKMFGVLEDIHGFVPGKNCKSAASLHIDYPLTIMMDISAFFDSVTRSHIPSSSLVTDEMFHKEGYAAQGLPTSPMLANISIVPIISRIKYRFLKEFGWSTYSLTVYADDLQISLTSENVDDISKAIEIVTQEFNKKSFRINKSKTRVRRASNGYRRILGINVGLEGLKATRSTRRKMRAAKHQDKMQSYGGHLSWSNHITS